MSFKTLSVENKKFLLINDDIHLTTVEDALEIIANVWYTTECDKVIIKKSQMNPDFFDLKTGFAGEVLQKFSTYNIKLGIAGDFDVSNSKSLRDFIYESNKRRKVVFADTIEQAAELLED